MNRFLRSFVRSLGYDGMAVDRFDRLRAGEEIAHTGPRVLRDFYALYAANAADIWLLQLGANDAARDDIWGFLREPANVTSLLVEPQPACIEKLRGAAQARPRWRILPVAFGESDGRGELHRFAAATEKDIQLDVFASFDRRRLEHTQRELGLGSAIVSEQVETCSLPTLLRRGGAPRVDILVCDIEGLDHAAIRQVAGLQPLPVIIVFEHRWLTPVQRTACYQLLDSLGYGIMPGPEDVCCVRLRPPQAKPDHRT